MMAFRAFNYYPVDPKEGDLIIFKDGRVEAYIDSSWCEILSQEEPEEVYNKDGELIGQVCGDRFFDWRYI